MNNKKAIGNIPKLAIEVMTGVFILVLLALFIRSYYTSSEGGGNNLCENKFTKAYYGGSRKDHEETKADGDDCCYWNKQTNDFPIEEVEGPKEWCKRLITTCQDSDDCSTDLTTDACDVPNKNKAYFLFDCYESVRLCDTEDCVQNCDRNGICDPGEPAGCVDC